jgi:two-component system sensor histidine kinase RpfC
MSEPEPLTMRQRLTNLISGAQRPELEQATLRLVIAGLVLGYLTWFAFQTEARDHPVSEVLWVAIVFFLFAGALAVRILTAHHVSVSRRFLGMVVDNAVTSYCLMRMGEGGAVIIGVYLFVAFGNGFRYGRLYLHFSQVMGLLGFSLVLMFSPFWSKHVAIGIGFILSMIVLPFYVGVLAERINEARKRADDANQAKGRFLANVSHEMRTPLNGVIAMADVLRETTLNESQREIVETLGTSAYLLLTQIEDVLDMAKIEAGRVQIEKRPFDLGKLLTSTIKVVMPQARYKGLEVKTEISAEAARWFQGDAHHLRQVLLNLLANAVKFTETGQILLRVIVVEGDAIRARVRFEVKDTGIGIPPGKQAAIFEPFTQADDSITRIYGGTGLGTTIARELVTLMDGQIGLESSVGVGSLFWFELPMPFGEATGIDLTAGSTTSLSTDVVLPRPIANVTKIRGARILVAEDNATNQRITRMILESGGHRVTIVENGEAALDALEQGTFDLALFDLSMPILSGLEALKLYRFTTAKPIPVLILSANVTTSVIAECQRGGAAEFIAKPMRASVLLEAIDNHLAAKADDLALTASIPGRTEERPTLTIIENPMVDTAVLTDLGRLSSDQTFVDRLIHSFRLDAERIVNEVRDGLAGNRYDQVKDAAHALKGGSASVGATQLVQLAIRLENSTHDTLRTKGSTLTEELSRVTNLTLAALEQHIKDRRTRSRK